MVNAGEAEELVDNILRSVDANQSGSIDYSEWVMATISRQKLLSKQRLETAFKMFDKVFIVFEKYVTSKNRMEMVTYLLKNLERCLMQIM